MCVSIRTTGTTARAMVGCGQRMGPNCGCATNCGCTPNLGCAPGDLGNWGVRHTYILLLCPQFWLRPQLWLRHPNFGCAPGLGFKMCSSCTPNFGCAPGLGFKMCSSSHSLTAVATAGGKRGIKPGCAGNKLA